MTTPNPEKSLVMWRPKAPGDPLMADIKQSVWGPSGYTDANVNKSMVMAALGPNVKVRLLRCSDSYSCIEIFGGHGDGERYYVETEELYVITEEDGAC